MNNDPVSPRYLAIRIVLALSLMTLLAVVSAQINRTLAEGVVVKATLGAALDDAQFAVTRMGLALSQASGENGAQRAQVRRTALRRGAEELMNARNDLARLLAGEGLAAETRRILADPLLNPLEEMASMAEIAGLIAMDATLTGEAAERPARVALDLGERLLPLIRQMKYAEEADQAEAVALLRRSTTGVLAGSLALIAATGGLLLVPLARRVLAAQSEIERRRLAAEQANSAKSQFLATMSHEIRTPMSGVLGMADVLRTTDLDAKQRGMLDIIVRSGRALMEIIDGVLDLARIESGQLVLSDSAFDAAQLCEEVTALFSGAATTRGLSIAVERRPGLAAAYRGDAGAVRQIVSNLVGNAVKFTDEGRITVAVGPGPGGEGLSITVRDTGIGIQAHLLDHVFESFAQADGASGGRPRGTGLGLAIVRRLAGAMGGTVTAESTAGAGSVFTLSLPLAPDSLAAEPAPRPRVAAFHPAGLDVLVAEDNGVNQIVIRAMLEQLGCRVRLAENGHAALDAVNAERPDLVLMDISMPELDGCAATRALRAREQTQGLPRLPVFGLSAHALVEDRDAALDAGMDRFITKPVSIDTLAEALACVPQPDPSR